MADKQRPLFIEREDGILEYCGSTEAKDAAACWQQLDDQIDVDIWSQASIAAVVVPVYGRDDINNFAVTVGKKGDWVRKMARTYKHFTRIDTRVSNSGIYFKHHVIAMRHEDPGYAVRLAAENGWSCAKLEEWVLEQRPARGGGEDGPINRSALMEYLEHVEEVIEEDFLENCPDRAFALRVFGAWRDEVRGENKRLYLLEGHPLVVDAIEREGARTVKEIVKKTGLRQGEVEAIVSELVGEKGTYEWIEQRGETDEARGGHVMILHKVGQRDGSAFNLPRTSSRYLN